VAARFAELPIPRLHVVDLDGAKAGRSRNGPAIRRIVERVGEVPVQLGGGIRTLAALEEALALGVERVILGTVALREPELVREAAERFPGCVVVGIDAKEGFVSVEGWLETSQTRAVEFARRFEAAGVAAIVYTDIERDGALQGINLEQTLALAEAVSIPVIASGGLAGIEDIKRLKALEGRGIAGAICGRALYDGRLDPAEALAVAKGKEGVRAC